YHGSRQARARGGLGASGRRHRPVGARIHQMGRSAGLVAAFRRVGGARLQDRNDAADGPGLSLARCRTAGKSDPECEKFAHSQIRAGTPPQGDSGALAAAAKMLVEAQNPLIICHRVARTPAGMDGLIQLAETLQCGVIDNVGRMNFPSRHPLNQSFRRGLIGQADVILAIEMNDLWGTLTHFSDRIARRSRPSTKPDAKIITLGVRDLYLKSNYQDFGRWQDVDLDIAGDGEASLPALTEAVKRLVDAGRKDAFAARGQKLAKL